MLTKTDLRLKVIENLPHVRAARVMPEFRALKMRQCRFLVALVQSSMIAAEASRRTGIHVNMHYYWKKTNEKYQAALERCYDIAGDTLESIMLDHAYQGFRTAVRYKGKIVGYDREYNAQERITLLKGLKHRYRENLNFAAIAGPQSLAVMLFGAEPQKSLTNQAELADKAKIISPPHDDEK